VAYEKLAYLGYTPIKECLRHEIEREERYWVVGRLCFAYSILIETPSEVEFVFKRLEEYENISFKFIEFLWFEVLGRFHSKGDVKKLLEFVENNPFSDTTLRALIEALGNRRLTEGIDFILRVYQEKEEDTLFRLSCVRALGNIGYEGFCEIFFENVKHEDWRVRAVVCKFAYLCSRDEVIESLKDLFKDPSYYVRINAGRALLHFKEKAKPVLESLLNSEDRFASDTARYLLSELEVKGA
jgi:HEAT repeat protein